MHKSSSLTIISRKFRNYPKTCGGVGVLTLIGLIAYEKHRIQNILQNFAETTPNETDKKRPDYIYIKYHIYKESMRKLKEKEDLDKKWISIITNPVGRWWKAAKHSIAWRLLRIAQTGSQHERLKAVRQLSSIDHLKDWDFRHLAQICDARTAVSLARSGADTRWFLPVHRAGCIKNPKIILCNFRKMLAKLKPNPCIEHFFVKYLPEQEFPNDISEFFTREQALTSIPSQDTDTLKEIIAFLHHITKDYKVAEKIVKEGGLSHLMELKKIFADDNETLSTLCKILANLSLVTDSVQHFFVTGWVRVLADWQKCQDLRLQVISAKVMANLDHDDPNRMIYPPNVYPLYPRLRTRIKPKADIVFIHGLLGGVFITWRQKDKKPTEIGLYGKNAFYTNDIDDIFLIGEPKRFNGKTQKNGNGSAPSVPKNGGTIPNNSLIKKDLKLDSILKTARKQQIKELEISDAATKELVENLQSEAELEADWEVVHPDVPLNANEDCDGEFSISGNQWHNQDRIDDHTNCWPMEWLPEDFPNARIIGVDYTSAVTEWSANFTKYCPCEKNQGHIDVRSGSLLKRLSRSDVGGDNRPVVWIGHSMGGILTKMMLMKAIDDPNPKVNQIAKNTTGIVFLGTPHRGSPIAKWKQHMQLILSPSIEVKEMEENAPNLLNLHAQFMNCLNSYFRNVKIVSIAEGSPTMLTTFKFPLRIVTEESARIDYGDFYILKDDHLSLSKPIFRQSFLYKRLLKVIEQSVNNKYKPSDVTNKLPIRKATEECLIQSQPSNNQVSSTKNYFFSLFPSITYKYPRSSIDM